MNCNDIANDLQAFLDNEVRQEECVQIESHLRDCKDCLLQLEDLKAVSLLLSQAEVPPPNLPSAAQLLQRSRRRSLLDRILDKIDNIQRSRIKLFIGLATATTFAIIFLSVTTVLYKSGSGSGYNISSPALDKPVEYPATSYKTPIPASTTPEPSSPKPSSEISPQVAGSSAEMKRDSIAAETSTLSPKLRPEEVKGRLIIKSAELTLETDDFDASKNKIIGIVKSNGGFITQLKVSSYSYSRSAEITLRVPANNFDTVISEIQKIGRSISENILGQDVTDQYIATREEFEIEKDLQAEATQMASSATSSEERLAAKRQVYEIARRRAALERQLKELIDGVNLSTITLTLHETDKVSSTSLGPHYNINSRFKLAFSRGLSNLIALVLPIAIFLIEYLPSLAVVSAVFYLIWRGTRKYWKRNRNYNFSDAEMRDWMK
ncbi:MAG: DUF4349 domain-containing protein [Acidobacteriota bacterium]|nr:DUF4349 domain-containing protein [Blastocatellia bacterium]MDW8411129.1 DUF4349 domain-containing protein [Acidobacteriota bacterium]